MVQVNKFDVIDSKECTMVYCFWNGMTVIATFQLTVYCTNKMECTIESYRINNSTVSLKIIF